jgi:hypothetical protein
MALLELTLGRIVLVAALCVAVPLVGASAPMQMTEPQVKAAMLYNFASFTEWPDPLPQERPLTIGVLGDDAIANALRSTARLGDGRRIDVRSLSESQDVKECRILYFAAIPERPLAATLARVVTMPVLTVGEHERFTQLGGIIRMYSENDRLRFEVDVDRATSVRLKISSRVLNLARIPRDADAPKR